MYAGSVRIGAIDYKISTSEQLSKHHGLDGQIAYDSAEITVNGGTEPQRQYAVLFHEILHGIFSDSRLSETLDKDPALLEDIIEVMAHGILGVIRDNPDLVREIRELWNNGGTE
jgi:Zn-dependent peptidase ImmA (M78 family)